LIGVLTRERHREPGALGVVQALDLSSDALGRNLA
jgi:hypothetical protein